MQTEIVDLKDNLKLLKEGEIVKRVNKIEVSAAKELVGEFIASKKGIGLISDV